MAGRSRRKGALIVTRPPFKLIPRRFWLSLALAAVAFGNSACAPPYPPALATPVPGLPEYRIGPEDVLDVFVYRAPELSGVAPVRPDGRISTPLSPDIVALGKTPTQLARAIEENLKKYVKEPNVTVLVTGFRGEPDLDVHIVGEVGRLRAIPYSAQLRLLDVVIDAGGLTRFAAGNRTLLVREGPRGPVTYRVRLADLIEDGDMTQNIPLRPGDTIIVPQAWF